jgi:RNA recognition motif-containing protein
VFYFKFITLKITEDELYNYEAHRAVLSKLKELGNAEKFRESWSLYQSVLLPSVEDWLRFTDGFSSNNLASENVISLKVLFDQALKDHPASVELWLKYLRFLVDNSECLQLDEASLLTEFKKAGGFCGLDVKRGHLIFEEQARHFPNHPIPHSHRTHFESLETNFPLNFDEYRQRIQECKFVPSGDKVNLIRVLYERVLDTNGSIQEWQEYLKFLREQMNVSTIVLGVNYRMIRAHPLILSSWTNLIENLELFHKYGQVPVELEKANKIPPFRSDRELFVGLKLSELAFLRRREVVNGRSEDLFVKFQSSLQEEELAFGPDPQARISRFFAQILTICSNERQEQQIEKMRRVWTHLLKIHAKEAAFWLEYLQLERAILIGTFSNRDFQMKLITSTFKRATCSVTDYPETIFYEWLQFEGQFGALESLLDARDRVEKQRKLLQEREDQRKGRNVNVCKNNDGDINTNESKYKATGKRLRSSDDMDNAATNDDSTADTPNPAVVKSFNPLATLFVNNLPFTLTEQDIQEYFEGLIRRLRVDEKDSMTATSAVVKSIRMHRSAAHNNSFKGHATIEFDSQGTAQAILNRFNREPFGDASNRPVFLAPYNSPVIKSGNASKSHSHPLDENTLYISNILEDSILTQKLLPLLQGVRQVRHVDGKRFAYIEFENRELAEKGLEMIENLSSSLKIKAAFSNPPKASESNTTKSTQTTTTQLLQPRSLMMKRRL